MSALMREGTLSKDTGSGLFNLTLDELQNELVPGSGKLLGSMNMVRPALLLRQGALFGRAVMGGRAVNVGCALTRMLRPAGACSSA
jgi:hypothetical protein